MIERIFRKLKVFRILSERYRNRRKRFTLRFNLIGAIYNLELNLTDFCRRSILTVADRKMRYILGRAAVWPRT